MSNYPKTHEALKGVLPDTDALRHLIAQRADRLTGRQRRKYDPAREAEIKSLQAAYDILAVAAHPNEMNISYERLANTVATQIAGVGDLRLGAGNPHPA